MWIVVLMLVTVYHALDSHVFLYSEVNESIDTLVFIMLIFFSGGEGGDLMSTVGYNGKPGLDSWTGLMDWIHGPSP